MAQGIKLKLITTITFQFFCLSRLLGSATVPLKDLVKDSSHTMQADVNLLDGSNRMTQVSA